MTRGQVAAILHRLAGEPEAQAEDFADVDYGAYYGPAIRWARSAGVINGYWDEGAQAYLSFGPDDPVTREQLATMLTNYAAQVTCIAIETNGAMLDKMPDANDVDDWARESVSWAMDAGLISGVAETDGSYVRPLATAQRCAMAKMASALHRDVLPPEVDGDAEPVIEYSPNVITAPTDNTSISEDGLTASIPAESLSEPVQEGDVIVVSDDGVTGTAILASTVATDGNRTIVTGTQPTLDQVYKQLSIEDVLDASEASFEPCNGFEIVEKESKDGELSATWDGEFSPEGIKKTITIKHEGELNLGDDVSASASGNIEVTLSPEAKYKFDYSGSSINLAYINLKTAASVKGSLDGVIQGSITVGEIKYGVFSIMVNLVAEATGELSLEYKPIYNVGFIYKNGKSELIKDAKSLEAQMNLEADVKLGPSLRAEVGILSLGCLYAEIASGAEAKASLSMHPDLACVSVNAWLFADVGTGLDGILIEALPAELEIKYTKPIWDEEKSPIKKSWHWENGAMTDSCTWPGGDESDGSDSGSGGSSGDVTILESGTCGTCIWTIDSNEVLTITPANGFIGYLEDWGSEGGPPWDRHANPVSAAVIKEGVRARTCGDLFHLMTEIKTIDLSGLDTSRVQDMGQMFFGCMALESVDISHLDTSNVQSMQMMLGCCYRLKTVDMSGIDTKQVNNIWEMFGFCSSLTTIYASDGFAPSIDRVIKPIDVFGYCEKLVGGNGTTFSEDHIYSDYAKIDESGSPGYFTLKP